MSIEISVVVIGRNEAEQIEDCLRSVCASLDGFQDYEVIYVDSASDDNTIEIASKFPIRILQLRPTWKLTPSAGRFIGYQHSFGEYLLFVDGDSTLCEDWLTAGYRFLTDNSNYGGVAGVAHRAFAGCEGGESTMETNYYQQPLDVAVQNVPYLAGSAMYRREALERAGPFNPYLPTGEECEIGLRIQRAGYRMARLNKPMYVKHTLPPDSWREIIRRSRSGLYDYGIPLRYCLAAGNGWRFSIAQMWFVFNFMAVMAALLIAVTVGVLLDATWMLLVAAGVVVALVVWKRKHPKSLAISFFKRSMMTYRTIKSVLTANPLPIDSYPTDPAIIKETFQLGAATYSRSSTEERVLARSGVRTCDD